MSIDNLQSIKPLETVSRLFEIFEKHKLNWMHWKSNEHLGASLLGETDLDLLFCLNEKNLVIEALQKAGFILFETSQWRNYHQIFDAICLDEKSGKIIHAHCHLSLTLGEKFLKSYTLQIDDLLFQKKIKILNNPPIYIIGNEDEAILLILREALKVRARDRFKFKVYGQNQTNSDFMRELKWLKLQLDYTDVAKRYSQLFNETISDNFKKVYDNPSDFYSLVNLKRELSSLLLSKNWRRLSCFCANLERWKREFVYYYGKVQTRFNLNLIYFSKRRFLKRGIVAVVLGVDGAGKSTITKKILKDWSKKIDIELSYLGTGDGKKSFFQKILIILKKIRKNKKKLSETSANDETLKMKHFVWAIAGAFYKKSELKRINKLSSRGVVVLCDRYPQSQFPGLADGPKLTKYIKSSMILKKYLAKLEQQIYQSFRGNDPDIVIKLNVSEKIALERKPGDITSEIFRKKTEVLEKLDFGDDVSVVQIDANSSLDEVVVEAKKNIWSIVRTKNV